MKWFVGGARALVSAFLVIRLSEKKNGEGADVCAITSALGDANNFLRVFLGREIKWNAFSS